MCKKLIIIGLIYILIILLFPLTTLAQSDGIPLQKDVFLESIRNPQSKIRNHMDLPDQITFNLYDSETAITPIARFKANLCYVTHSDRIAPKPTLTGG